MKWRGGWRVLTMGAVAFACSCSQPDEKVGNVFGSGETPKAPPMDWPTTVASDQMTIRKIELVARPDAQFGTLAALEIPVEHAPDDVDGERVLTIVTTGADAENLRRYGFEPTLPRLHRTGTGALRPLAASPVPGSPDDGTYCESPTVPIDTSDCDFPLYDDTPGLNACNGGIAKELSTINLVSSGITATNVSLGATYEHRGIAAVRFGPDAFTSVDVPTHYIFGTHHAREWMSTAVVMKLIRWLRDIVNGTITDEGRFERCSVRGPSCWSP